MRNAWFAVCVAAATAGLAFSARAEPAPKKREEAIRRGVAYLLASQNPDGSWGSFKNALYWDVFWSNPETHRAWRVATAGLSTLALMREGRTQEARMALERGVDFLVGEADLKRPNEWDTDQVWGWIYALEALATAERHAPLAARKAKIRTVVGRLVGHLARYQTPAGGWAYYDFGTKSAPPSWATSFTTANAVLALRAARDAGHTLPPKMLEGAVEAVRRSRLPNGAYTYSVEAIGRPSPDRPNIHNIKGSLSRIQIGNLVLFLEKGGVSEKDLVRGLDLFFEHHKFLEIACYRPIPHEAYYQNSGYFYLYGHAYAARVLRLLPKETQERLRARLAAEILKLQQEDGSFWDFPMQGYAKPYGTAFALLALAD